MRKSLVLDPFCLRQFVPGTFTHIPYDASEFLSRVQEQYSEAKLRPGYADFCKHIFVENFTEALVTSLEITPENEHLITTAYEARTETELPVLVRYFPHNVVGHVPRARYLDVILYSYEQIQKEYKDRGEVDQQGCEYDWGIISVKPQDQDYELPMQPITMMRNALGREEGGSGVRLDRDEYRKSVDYWRKFALVK
jgi:hypothetical protein